MNSLKLKNILDYNNKTLVLTGSSGQLGVYISNFFLNLGCKVYGLDKVKKKSFYSKNFFFKKVDISNEKQTSEVLKYIKKKEKKIDIIINGAAYNPVTHFSKRNKKELTLTSNTNIIGTINLIRAFYKIQKNNCKIINIGSVYGVRSPDFKIYGKKDRISSEIYGGSKAAIIQITKYFAVFLSKYNVSVNCISPGGILNKVKQNKTFIKKYSNKVPIKRMGKPEDLSMALLYFSSELTNYTTGQNLVIDGGFTIC